MVSSHTQTSLNLSALNSDVEYPLPLDNTAQKCFIHVKLTESCSKAIDSLISSNKGAVFSLKFTENGGHLTLPSLNGNHTFQFSTAVPGKREQNSALECFHQHTTQDRQQKLAMIGRLEHKLTVKATEDIYEETMKKAKQLEEERQGVRAKEIKIPKVKPKVSSNRAIHKPSFDTSVISRSAGAGKGVTVGGSGGGASNKPQFSTQNRAQQKSLKERVIHILAIRPCRRIDVLSKLKKATKKGDTFFSSLDNVLGEVANLQDSTYHLKETFISELDVDNWPFYSEAEREFVKRKLSKMTSSSAAASNNDNSNFSMPSIKRSMDESTVIDHTPPPKRPKPEFDPVSSQVPPNSINSSSKFNKPPDSLTNEKRPQPPRSLATAETSKPDHNNESRSSRFLSSRHNHAESVSNQRTEPNSNNEFTMKRDPAPIPLPLPQVHSKSDKVEVLTSGTNMESVEMTGHEDEEEGEKSKRHKKKKKKKHKQENSVVANGPLSDGNTIITTATTIAQPTIPDTTTVHDSSIPVMDNNNPNSNRGVTPQSDFDRLYPKITSYAKRTEYKKVFNEGYEEYLSLTKKMEEMHREVTELTNHYNSLHRNSPEVREVKHRIKKKYYETQKDPAHREEKQRLSELHNKLEHIKKMVMLFDAQCAGGPSTP